MTYAALGEAGPEVGLDCATFCPRIVTKTMEKRTIGVSLDGPRLVGRLR